MKKNLLSLLAVIVAIAFSAFSSKQSSTFADFYYGYDSDQDKYFLIEGGTDPGELDVFCIPAGQQICIKRLTTNDTPPPFLTPQEAEELDSFGEANHAFDFESYDDQ